MPRKQSSSIVDRRINDIVSRAARDVHVAVKQYIADELRRAQGGKLSSLGKGGISGLRKRRVIVCPVPSCGKPGGGPKWGWFCAEHKGLPDTEKEKARAATRGNGAKQTKATRGGRRKKLARD